MKKILLSVYVMLLISCPGQEKILYRPEPGYNDVIQNNPVSINDITETRGGQGNTNIPGWLSTFLSGGIAEVEKINAYRDKFCFVAVSEGGNFNALNKWAANYSLIHDFPRVSAVRIEKRMISAATLYPDDEYGSFFEIMVKKAFDTEFPGASLEETFWIRKKVERYDPENESYETAEVYTFYILISVSKTEMTAVIEKMITETLAGVTPGPTRAQNNAIRRLQQNFFSEF